jgi:hypothetical protein
VPEVPLDFSRAWVEFVDPADAEQVIRADLTWLTSRWSCLYGSGRCPGIYAERPDDGCCTLGAHYSDTDDEKRVAKVARKLTAAQWQYKPAGRSGISEVDDEGSRKTRVVDGGCIFLNRPGFSGGTGCALHSYALATGTSIVDTKPDVCWQLPIRRQFRDVERPDGSTYTEVTITEYERRGWGPGGHDLDWYCSGNSDAHIGSEPVYLSSRDELVALLGEPAYAQVAAACASRIADQPRAVHQIAGHPATVAAEAAEAVRRRRAKRAGSEPKPG